MRKEATQRKTDQFTIRMRAEVKLKENKISINE